MWWWGLGEGGYGLMVRHGAATWAADVPASPRPLNLTAGPDADGRAVLVYTRCAGSTAGCQAYTYDVAARRERRLGVGGNVVWAARWRGTLVFVRAVRVGGRRPGRCDVPYAQAPGSGRARRLDRGRCGEVTGLALRGSTIALTVTSPAPRPGDAQLTSQARLLSTAGGATRVLRSVSSGSSSNTFAGPTLDARYLYVTHVGQQPRDAFVRVILRSGAGEEVLARASLVGALAVDGSTWVYETGDLSFTFTGTCPFASCLLVATTNPFGPGVRALPPQMIQEGGPPVTPPPPPGEPLMFAGRLTSTVVRRGQVVRADGLGGVRIDVVSHTAAEILEGIAHPTGLSTTTTPDGYWAIAAPPPTPETS